MKLLNRRKIRRPSVKKPERIIEVPDVTLAMLVLSRKKDESIIIGDGVEITIVDVKGDTVKLGVTAPKSVSVYRKEIFEALRAENIGVNVHYMPLHLQPFYQNKSGYKKGDYPKAEKYYERAITLPVFPKMSDEDTKDVIEGVYKVFCYYRR